MDAIYSAAKKTVDEEKERGNTNVKIWVTREEQSIKLFERNNLTAICIWKEGL